MPRPSHAASLTALALAALAAAGCREAAAPPARQGSDLVLRREVETIEANVPGRATLDTLLSGQQLAPAFVQAAVASVRGVFDPRQLRAGHPFRLVRFLDGRLREFEYRIDMDRLLRIACRDTPASTRAEVVTLDKDTAPVTVRGRIEAAHPSIIAAIDAAGEKIQLAMSLAALFAGQVDFESDLQPGDGFEVLLEKSTRDGEFAGYGPVLAARLVVDGREHDAFRWTDPATGTAAFYDGDGRSLKRFFLRSPLRFEPRVTSGFSRNRLHPVFRTYRAHLGVDYAAPVGAPVVAVSGGTVVSAGWSGGGGNMVRLRHASGFESYYLHLSAIGKGIRPAQHVEQGQLIGRVGATGTATGPHLDYRLRKNGSFVDPLAEHRKLPPGEPIPSRSLAGFRAARDSFLDRMSAAAPSGPPAPRHDAVAAAR